MPTDKLTGIIYRAYNTISGKSYIGQTVSPLKIRIRQHYSKAKKTYHKFANALKYYSIDSWEWTVLAEVEIEKLDEYELFFIKDLDTFNNGYNSTLETYEGTRKINCCDIVYSLYHPDFGIISASREELKSICFELARVGIYRLLTGECFSCNGWVLAENKDIYWERFSSLKPITLSHPELGTYTQTRKEFREKFGICSRRMSELILKKRKSYKGWRLVEDESTIHLNRSES